MHFQNSLFVQNVLVKISIISRAFYVSELRVASVD